ncbi:hypothetical protein KC19_10G026500 [Ceratodon purpureus]|uniref:Protein kinase domain-containing protein n=1 Tax=Ceratodon purpureus TaxID=3225 RepID=A0A8T0GL13_CERPU|nr:hypothetical protein KC19_10G026500 [Ceratodon purpureus]
MQVSRVFGAPMSTAAMACVLCQKIILSYGLVMLLFFSCHLFTGVQCQLDSKVQFSPQDMVGMQALWRAWKKNSPNLAKNFRGWGNDSAMPCNNDLNYTVSGRGWNGVGCQFQLRNATSAVWSASVGMLILPNDKIVGILPPEVSLLSNLQYLYLYNNPALSGPIPKELGLLSNLNIVDLSLSNFTGQVPDLSNLTNLTRLDLSGNRLDGPFPTLPQSLELLEFNISGNLFKGVIPYDAFRTEKNYLITLDISNNEFTCPLPKFSSSLSILKLSNNRFTCPTPDFTYLSSLTTLNLSSNLFTGLSNNMSSLKHILPQDLSVLDLSSLNISGPLPDWSFLTPGSKLSELYLDKNNLTGILNIAAFAESNISKSLKVLSLKDNMITGVLNSDEVIRAGQLKIRLKGNPYCRRTWSSQDDAAWCAIYCEGLCKPRPESNRLRNTTSKPVVPHLLYQAILKLASHWSHKRQEKVPFSTFSWNIIILAATSSSVVVLMFVLMGLVFILRRSRKCMRALPRKIKEADINAKRFEYNELRAATKNFAPDMKLGAGAYGAVYKGILVNNVVVAVKQLFQETNKGRDDFVNEVLLIANLQHRNLVTLKGYCLHGKQTLLVYEYVDNCDLHELLLSRQDKSPSMDKQILNWQVRLNICQGVAQGLYYLHASSQSRIIHRDIKASNILLDKNLQPKIADFGLARPIEDARSVIITQQCAGTLGYVAPEYMDHGELSDKADVYSFGVLLLEIVSGKRNRDLTMPEDEVYLPNRAWKLHKENRLLDLKDPTLLVSDAEAVEVQRVLETAVLCVQNAPEKRPSMFQVAAMLAGNAYADVLPTDDHSDSNWPAGGGMEADSYNCETPLCSLHYPSRSAGLVSEDYQLQIFH